MTSPSKIITLTVALAGSAALAETRQLDAHQHGHGALNIAFEGRSVAMELEVPGADIVGFEYAATTAEDRATVDAAIARLAKPLELFVLPAEAGCTVTAANVALIGADDHGDHDDHGDDHGHEDEHGHDEHADEDKHAHDEDHAHGDKHAHDDKHDEAHAAGHGDEAHDAHDAHGDEAHEGEAQHTEFHAEYGLTCEDPSAIAAIEFVYFSAFPNAEELDVQMISDKGARGYEVERDAPRLDLTGAI